MAGYDSSAARHHRPTSTARAESLAGAIDQESVSIPRSPQPCSDRVAQAPPGGRYQRAGRAGNSSHHKRDSRGAAQQRLGEAMDCRVTGLPVALARRGPRPGNDDGEPSCRESAAVSLILLISPSTRFGDQLDFHISVDHADRIGLELPFVRAANGAAGLYV